MNYQIELLDELSILVVRVFDRFDIREDLRPLTEKLHAILDSASRPLLYVNEIRNLRLDFTEIQATLSALANRETGIIAHPNFEKMFVAAHADLVAMGEKALAQLQLDEISVEVFTTLEEALAAARQQSAQMGHLAYD